MATEAKPALLFPGQGSQFVGMGLELYENFPVGKAVFKEADEALGFHLSHLIFEGPAEALQLTEHTQPAILTVSVAAYRALAEAVPGLVPAFAAGHSLGEYSAHVAAGTLSFAEAVCTVRSRGRFMQQAVPQGQGAMAAILGLGAEEVNDLCSQAGDELSALPPSDTVPTESGLTRADVAHSIVAPANLNSPEQVVISGAMGAVLRAVELCKAAGAKKTVMLNVSAPFHCGLMQPAQDLLANTLEGVTFNDPAFPVAANVDARLLTRRADVRDCLIRQVTAPVRWVECVELLVAQGATHLIELGPGKVLTGLTRQILGRGVESPMSLNVEDKASLEKTVAALSGGAAVSEARGVGDVVEDFTAQDQDGKTVSLSEYAASPVVLFFYPRADTPGCTVEACSFRDAVSELKDAGAVVLGISRDMVKAQKKFAEKFELRYPLLADPDEKICNWFGVIQPKNMYGKLVKGVQRNTYLIGPASEDGKQRIEHVWTKVKPEGHAEEVLAFVRSRE